METSWNQLPCPTGDSCCCGIVAWNYVPAWSKYLLSGFTPRKMCTGPEQRQPQPTDRFIGGRAKEIL